MELTENAKKILAARYLNKSATGEIIETPEQMLRRVAHYIAQADMAHEATFETDAALKRLEDEFYAMMDALEFLPNSPTLMNAGNPLAQLAACFVLPVNDDMESIGNAIKNSMLIHKTGGGTGFSFSQLRPAGDMVKSTSGVSSGPISFIKAFDAATETVKQGGRRRGANMGVLRVDHPDILAFIACKDKEGYIGNFNISVAITDKFMEAVKANGPFELINPRTKNVAKIIPAREIFDAIVNHAWANGEPGVLFIDAVNRANPLPGLGEIESTNPCGEQPLFGYESCVLGSINLSKFVVETINWKRLEEVTRLAVHFLDNVIDMNKYPLPEIERMSRANRKIGLGVMGWADTLTLLEIPYDSEDALKLAETVMDFIAEKAQAESIALAKMRGSYPNWEKSTAGLQGQLPRRNATLTTIAPTGTIGAIANASGGIEPHFGLIYTKENVLGGVTLHESNCLFKPFADKYRLTTDDLALIKKEGSLRNITKLPDAVKAMFRTAHDISPEMHIRMQASFQKYVENSISKTINMPEHATREDVAKAYLQAYELGCKGLTVYRNNSRDIQVLNLEHKEKKEAAGAKPQRREIKGRRSGETYPIITGCGQMLVTVNELRAQPGVPQETIINLGKSGGCAASQCETTGRLISLALQYDVPVASIIKIIKGVRCSSPAMGEGGVVYSCADAIAKALEDYLVDQGSTTNISVRSDICPDCPDCGGKLVHTDGCVKCESCGWSKCE